MATKTKKIPKRTPLRQPRQLEQPLKEQPLDPRNAEAIQLLDSWDEATPEDIQEQRETWTFLKRALDEDRLSPERRLFPAS